jgi:hypothetical protein
MGVEKTFADVVRVFVVIDVFMMAAMFARPHENRILERSGAEDQCEQAHGQSGPESHVRKQTVITERDAKSGRARQHCKDGEMEPINPEIPQVERHRRECKNKRADKERTRCPINAAGWNSEDQGQEIGEASPAHDMGRARITSSFVQV